MLRVLHCIYDDPRNPWVGGGGAVRAYELYRRLAPRLAEVTVATGAYPGARDEEIDGVGYRRLGLSNGHLMSRATYCVAASRMLAEGAYDVAVYDFSTYTPLRLPHRSPFGITVHHVTGATASERWGPVLGSAIAAQELKRLRRGNIFSATSEITRDRLRELLGPAARIHLIEAGVPDELFELDRQESDYLLYFGRLDWFQKGLDVLLQAMRDLAGRRPGIKLKVAGRGKDLERLVAETRTLQLEANIEIVGPVGDAERTRLLAGAQVLLMPSRFEGFGMVAAEAMAAGVPVVAADAGSLPEVVDPPRGGVLVPVGDAGALADAVDSLLDDPVRRNTLSNSARLSAERFRWNHIADQHMEFLEDIHTSAPPADLKGNR